MRVEPHQKADLGIFAQDSWTLDRLTVNGGLRVEWQNSYVPEQIAPAGRFVGERHFAAVPNVPKWGPISRRASGSPTTCSATRRRRSSSASGKYMTRQGVGLPSDLNPMASVTSSLPWNDRGSAGRSLATNGDDIVQDNELDLTRLPTQLRRADSSIGSIRT